MINNNNNKNRLNSSNPKNKSNNLVKYKHRPQGALALKLTLLHFRSLNKIVNRFVQNFRTFLKILIPKL